MSSPVDQQFPAGGDPGKLEAFRRLYDFGLDPFQVDACEALALGQGVLVAAPTGAGKTVVGEFAVHLALESGRKCFYTTPIKALSNQKYGELLDRYGPDKVGLLTGDNTINGEAPVVVMTTEVLRNMLYAGSGTLSGLGYVVMDEVHYLADPFRGAAWEEVIIHLPESVALVALSATVSNAEEFGEWIATVRGDTAVIVEERRPVPLYQHIMVGKRMYDLFADTGKPDERPAVNPELVRLIRDHWRVSKRDDRGPRRGRGNNRRNSGKVTFTPARYQVAEKLESEALLPAIVFIFSRQACDAAVLQCLYSGIRLTTPEERQRIRAFVEAQTAEIPDEDLAVLGYPEWLEGLERGLAAHHAGMLPTFKECVEALFAEGLVKVVFATETLALGINMPARSVVLEKLVKWNGQTHADITPGEYTQLTGRAGRRGIDVEGHGVVLWQPGLDPTAVAGLASTRTYPLRSSFRPSYNMAVNLVRDFGRERARELLEASFAQFQADRAVVGLARQVRRNEEALDGYREATTCHLGDFMEYAGIRRRISDREAELSKRRRSDKRAQVAESLRQLKTGDIIHVPAGKRAGLAVVLDPGYVSGGDGPRPTVLTADRQVRRLSMTDFPVPVEAQGRMRLPRSFNPRNAQARRDLASALREKAPAQERGPRRLSGGPAGEDETLLELRAALRAHPCHGCDEREDHARWAERYFKLDRETRSLQRRIEQRSNTIARQFDRVCEVLNTLGYLDSNRATPDGERLARIYTELDLVAAECLRQGTWNGLSAAELAACLSALVYESRTPDDVTPPKLPGGAAKPALASLVHIWGELDALERDFKLDFLREPDLNFAWAAFRWAGGASLADVLDETGLAAGDFVRWVKQILDLADQIADAAGDTTLRRTARQTVEAMRRGVVAYASISA